MWWHIPSVTKSLLEQRPQFAGWRKSGTSSKNVHAAIATSAWQDLCIVSSPGTMAAPDKKFLQSSPRWGALFLVSLNHHLFNYTLSQDWVLTKVTGGIFCPQPANRYVDCQQSHSIRMQRENHWVVQTCFQANFETPGRLHSCKTWPLRNCFIIDTKLVFTIGSNFRWKWTKIDCQRETLVILTPWCHHMSNIRTHVYAELKSGFHSKQTINITQAAITSKFLNKILKNAELPELHKRCL